MGETVPKKRRQTVTSIWAEKAAPSRGPKPALDRVQIALAAIRVADAEGLEAVTMQRIAREVGLTTMALYRYFRGKAELVALMIDSAGEAGPGFARGKTSWETRLKGWARRCLEIYRRHPWFLEATTARQSAMGPNELTWMETALAILGEAGLGGRRRNRAFLALMAVVRGHATFGQAQNDAGGDLERYLDGERDRFPALLDAMRAGAFSAHPDAAFEFGLECLVVGVRATVKSPGNPAPAGRVGRQWVRREPLIPE